MGFIHGEKPLRRKELIRPALTVSAASSFFPAMPLALDATQPHADPLVECLECRAITVLEVLELSTCDSIDIIYNLLEAVTVVTTSAFPDRVFE